MVVLITGRNIKPEVPKDTQRGTYEKMSSTELESLIESYRREIYSLHDRERHVDSSKAKYQYFKRRKLVEDWLEDAEDELEKTQGSRKWIF